MDTDKHGLFSGSLCIIHTIMCFLLCLQFYHVVIQYITCHRAFQGNVVCLDEIHVSEESWNSLGRNLFFHGSVSRMQNNQVIIEFSAGNQLCTVDLPSF